MKKIVILMIIISFAFIGILPAEGIGFGVKGGLNLANITGDDVDDAKIKLGMTVGGFATYPLGDKLVIRPEVTFTQKGYRMEESEEGYDYKGTVKMNWLDIPILAVFEFAEGIKAFVGPYFDLYLGGEFVVESDFGDFDESIEGEDVNSLGMGLIFGGAYGITESIDVETRVALGLTSMDEDFTIKNFGIQILANYYLKK